MIPVLSWQGDGLRMAATGVVGDLAVDVPTLGSGNKAKIMIAMVKNSDAANARGVHVVAGMDGDTPADGDMFYVPSGGWIILDTAGQESLITKRQGGNNLDINFAPIG